MLQLCAAPAPAAVVREPVRLFGAAVRAVQIAAGAGYSAALTADGDVYVNECAAQRRTAATTVNEEQRMQWQQWQLCCASET